MLKRILTGIAIIVVLAAFMLCGYFISPIFVDMLILLFLAGAVSEMFKCLKNAGYDMYPLPPIIMLLLAYPTFYLMQHFIGGSAGLQGILIVLLISLVVCLTVFTFKPHLKKYSSKIENKESNEAENQAVKQDLCQAEHQSECVSQNAQISHNEIANGNAAMSKGSINNLFANVFLIAYPMIFMTVAWVMSYKYSAFFAVLFAIAVPAIGSDMFAYFVGSLIGGKKLCPSISPKKTVAGAIGGLVGGMVLSIIFWAVFEYVGSISSGFVNHISYVPFITHTDGGWMWKSALIYLAIGAVCGVVSELGDLAASAIKRALGIKDYGKIFPGHGGFMDRIDSVMYCLVVLLIAFTCIYSY